jgi:hypothetical protein
MKFLLSLYIYLIIVPFTTISQEDWSYKIYGFVKTDVMMDTRQTVAAREGHVLLYPANRLEANGEDANEGINFNILSIQSRFGFKVKAPDILGAKSSGLMEGEFFGSSNTDVGSVRLRHAIVKLDWGEHEVMAGHFWNPLFIEDAYAGTISFNTGIPFVAFSRAPLVKYSYKPGKFKIHFSAVSERDFTSTGPIGESSSYLRNSGIPIVNLGINYNNGTVFLAANTSYKEIKPRLITEKGFKENNTTGGIISNALIRFTSDDFYITASALYGQNTHDLLMIGGYAVSSVSTDDGIWEYTPINIGSVWIDTQIGKELSFGLFGGYSKNLGADKEIKGNYFSRGKDIDYIYRLSPRISYKIGMTQLAAEFEYTVAAYGKTDTFGKVYDSNEIDNLRVLLAAFIYF